MEKLQYTVAPALNLKYISPPVIGWISYSGKNGHYIELNKVPIPIVSKLIFVKVINAQTLYIPSFKADIWDPGKYNLKFYSWNVLHFLTALKPYV